MAKKTTMDQVTNEFRASIKESMKTIRLESGMSADQFASVLGVSSAYVYMLESGERNWNNKLVDKVFDKLANPA